MFSISCIYDNLVHLFSMHDDRNKRKFPDVLYGAFQQHKILVTLFPLISAILFHTQIKISSAV